MRYALTAALTLGLTACLPVLAMADLGTEFEPSVEWLVDASDAVVVARIVEGTWNEKQNLLLTTYQVTKVLKGNELVQPEQKVVDASIRGQVGESVMLFLRSDEDGLSAFNASSGFRSARKVAIWDTDKPEVHNRLKKCLAYDKEGAIISDSEELIRIVEARIHSGDRVPADCDFRAVQQRRSFRGGFYVRSGFAEYRLDNGWEFTLDLLVPPDPEYRERFEKAAARYTGYGQHLRAQAILRNNYSKADPQPPDDLPVVQTLARELGAGSTEFSRKTADNVIGDSWNTHGADYYRISPCGEYLLELGAETLTIREMGTDTKVFQGAVCSNRPYLSFSPCGSYYAWKDPRERICLFDFSRKRVCLKIEASVANHVQFSSDGAFLGIMEYPTDGRKFFSLWNIAEGTSVFRKELHVNWPRIRAIATHHDVIVIKGRGIVEKDGKPKEPKFQFKDLAASKIQEICNDLLPPLALPRLAASKARTEEDTVLLLDLKTGQLVREIRASADLFAFGPLGKRMAYVRETAANDAGRDKQRSIFVEHTRTGETIRRIDLPTRPYSCATVSTLLRRIRLIDNGRLLLAEFDADEKEFVAEHALLFTVDSNDIDGEVVLWSEKRLTPRER